MSLQLKKTILTLLVFAVFASSVVMLQRELVLRWRSRPYQYRGALFLPSTEYIRAASLGYDQFMSDFLWMRMIQSFASAWSVPENAAQMKAFFDVITDLDPRFEEVYRFTIMAVGENGHRNDLIREVVDKAIVKMPGNYKIPFEGAFYALKEMDDPQLSKLYINIAMKDPNRPEYIDRWLGYIDQRMGKYKAAVEWYMHHYIKMLPSGNEVSLRITRTNLVRALNEWFREEIRQRAIAWCEAHGSFPKSIDEMNKAGLFDGIELPDVRKIYGIMVQAEQGQLDLRIDDSALMKNIEIITHPQPWKELPPGPEDDLLPGFSGFVIWGSLGSDHENFILSYVEALRQVKAMLTISDESASKYKDAHGQYPPDLKAFNEAMTKIDEPFGGQWIYDPTTGQTVSSTYPNLLQMTVPDS